LTDFSKEILTIEAIIGSKQPQLGLPMDMDKKRWGMGRIDDWPDLGLPGALPPHPPCGHLLPQGEGGEAAPPKGSLRIGLLQRVEQTSR
jgi:hypothetical protein